MVKESHSKLLGVDFDPNKDMKIDVKDNGEYDVEYKGSEMKFTDYVDEMEDRAVKHQQGKSLDKSIGMFSGFGKGTLNKK